MPSRYLFTVPHSLYLIHFTSIALTLFALTFSYKFNYLYAIFLVLDRYVHPFYSAIYPRFGQYD